MRSIYEYSTLPKAESITLETGRTYHTIDGSFPSITTVLGATSKNKLWLDAWKERVGEEEASRVSKYATDRGELVHSFAEQAFNGVALDFSQQPHDVILMSKALIKEGQKYITKVYAQEIAVWSPTLEAAGRLDLVGEWNGIPSIVDFKTSKKKKTVSQIEDYYIQVCFYAVAHNELFNTKINNGVILIAVEDGTVQVFKFNTAVYVGHLKQRLIQHRKLVAYTRER